MATFSVVKLSESTNGRQIKVVPTATAGQLVHTAHATAQDEVHLYLYNHHTADVLVTIEFGGATSPDDLITQTIPFASGLVKVLDGVPLTGGVTVRLFAATANVIMASGYVNRIA